jgi:YHS domain-containing protein
MKTLKTIVVAALLALPLLSQAADEKKAAKPYPLKKCVVSDEEIGKDPDMKPHVFTYKGQEVKLCCSGCKKDFDKEPAKYLKKIEDAQKK